MELTPEAMAVIQAANNFISDDGKAIQLGKRQVDALVAAVLTWRKTQKEPLCHS